MNTNKILLSGLAGGVFYFLAGWLVYGVLLADQNNLSPDVAAVVEKEDPVIWAIAISCLAFGLLFAVIYGRWASISTFRTGFLAGAVISLLIALTVDFNMFAMLTFVDLKMIGIDLVLTTILGGLTGGVVGWVLGYKRS